jgi:steroid delta-isomerase-like uncharacterized protein
MSTEETSASSVERQDAALRLMQERVLAGDAKGYAAVYAPDATISIVGGDEITGAAIERYEADLMRQFPGARFGFFDVWHAPPWAVAHYGVSGSTSAGRSMGHEGLLRFRFNASGKIQKEHRYLDSVTPMAQLGAVSSITPRSIPVVASAPVRHVRAGSSRESANLRAVTASLAALQARDTAAFLSHVTDAIQVDELMLPNSFRGREQVKAWCESWPSAVANAVFAVTRTLAIDDAVFVEMTVKGRVQEPFAGLSPSERPFAIHRGLLIRLQDGKLTRVSSFVNRKEFAEAIGQWPLR